MIVIAKGRPRADVGLEARDFVIDPQLNGLYEAYIVAEKAKLRRRSSFGISSRYGRRCRCLPNGDIVVEEVIADLSPDRQLDEIEPPAPTAASR